MTRNEYMRALARLRFRPASKVTAQALGVTVRQLQRYKDGENAIPDTLERLLWKYLESIPPKERGKIGDEHQ